MSIECIDNKVVIRMAEPNDLPEIFNLVDCYDGPVKIDVTKTKNSLRDIVYIHGVFLAEYNDEVIGGVAGIAMPCLFDNDITYCVLFLFIRPEFRKLTTLFIRELELCLLATKCTKITFGMPSSDFYHKSEKMQRYMRILGYKELETHFFKRF